MLYGWVEGGCSLMWKTLKVKDACKGWRWASRQGACLETADLVIPEHMEPCNW